MQNWHFVIVTDDNKKAALAELFYRGWETYVNLPLAVKFNDSKRNAIQSRIMSSAKYLVDHLKEVLVHVIPCIAVDRSEEMPTVMQSAVWGSIAPAA
jgi:nitroreductase